MNRQARNTEGHASQPGGWLQRLPRMLKARSPGACAVGEGYVIYRRLRLASPTGADRKRLWGGTCVWRRGGRVHGGLCGTGVVRADAGGAGRQPIPGHLHSKQVRGPWSWNREPRLRARVGSWRPRFFRTAWSHLLWSDPGEPRSGLRALRRSLRLTACLPLEGAFSALPPRPPARSLS